MLPYYPSSSKEANKIKLRVSRYGKKHNIDRKISKGIYTKSKICPKCQTVKSIHDFSRYNPTTTKLHRTAYCLTCRTEYNKKYEDKRDHRKRWFEQRVRALRIISHELECVRCGCDDVRFLEINHKFGRSKTEDQHTICNSIIRGIRKTDDLELLCRPCNHIHYLEMKYGEKIPLRVVYETEKPKQ